MKTVILCGGYGTRIRNVADNIPKPMIPIGELPILWHIMKYYSKFDFDEFVLCLGYKSQVIKDFFLNYGASTRDFTLRLGKESSIEYHTDFEESNWKVTLAETGQDTMTGGRINRIKKYVENDDCFMLTYGDGVSDIDIGKLVKFHKSHGKLMTMTSAQPDGRFGALDIASDNKVQEFQEKPKGDGSWINAGFFVCEPEVFDYITQGDSTVFEQQPLKNLAKNGEIYTYKHDGFWMPMDTLRDKNVLSEKWDNDDAPWKTWD